MFGKLGEMGSLLQKAQKMQEEVKRVQAELAATEIIGKSGNGQVETLVSGDFTVKRIVIRPEACPEADPELLAELVREAVNDALGQIRRQAQEKMRAVTGGLNLPGLNLN